MVLLLVVFRIFFLVFTLKLGANDDPILTTCAYFANGLGKQPPTSLVCSGRVFVVWFDLDSTCKSVTIWFTTGGFQSSPVESFWEFEGHIYGFLV